MTFFDATWTRGFGQQPASPAPPKPLLNQREAIGAALGMVDSPGETLVAMRLIAHIYGTPLRTVVDEMRQGFGDSYLSRPELGNQLRELPGKVCPTGIAWLMGCLALQEEGSCGAWTPLLMCLQRGEHRVESLRWQSV